MQEQSIEFARSLKAHDHAIAFYEEPDEKWRLISNFLGQSLKFGEPAFYVCYFEDPDTVRDSLKGHGIDVRPHERRGSFKILELGDHVKAEEFDTIASELKLAYAELSRNDGTIRAAADSTLTIKNGYAQQLLNYERWIGKTVGLSIAGVCAYDAEVATSPSDEFFLELLKLHGQAIFPGIAVSLV